MHVEMENSVNMKPERKVSVLPLLGLDPATSDTPLLSFKPLGQTPHPLSRKDFAP
jgi:hypothetical protein